MREKGNHTDDQTIWRQMQQGQNQALAAIYDKYVNALYNYGRGFTAKSEVIEDAIQDLLTEIWTRRDRLATPESVKGYLLRAFRQKLLRLLTQENRWQLVSDYSYFNLVASPTITTREDSDETLLFKRKLKKVINSLSARQQEAITLRYTENLTHQEVAEVMDIKVQTLYNLLHTATQKLGKSFQQVPHPVYTFLSLL
ncbi:MAG: RNA polymerase sigma factor [Cyclobacteriaceae bacterium]